MTPVKPTKYFVWDEDDSFQVCMHSGDDGQNWREAENAVQAAWYYTLDWGDDANDNGEYYTYVLPEDEARQIFADTNNEDMDAAAIKVATHFRGYTEWHIEEVEAE